MGRTHPYSDWLTVFLIILISGFGLFLQLTVNSELFRQQAVFLVFGAVLAILLSRIDWMLLWWISPLLYPASLLALAVTYLGPSVRGATRWIMVGGYQLQPSEIVKPMLLLVLAWLIVRYPPRQLKYLLFHVAAFSVPLVLVFRQPDLGTSIVYTAMWLAMLVAGGLPLRLVALTGISLFLITPFVWRLLAPYQQARVMTFINPALDPKGAGYNALQATIAVGSGQWFGRGLGLGTQSHLRFLPEFHTDFIFATLVEELGLAGGTLLLILYVLLLWQLVAKLHSWYGTSFSFVYSVGLFAMLLTQIFINTGMNMGILPITGITLPLVSYGGSSLMSLGIAFGLYWALIPKREGAESVAIS